jgi:DNA-binding NarL/FixJ family response regulator
VTTVKDVALIHDPSLLQSPELVQSVTAVTRLVLENARMHAELRARIDTEPRPLADLTARELEVLKLIADGRTDRPKDSALENRRVHAVLTFLRSQS